MAQETRFGVFADDDGLRGALGVYPTGVCVVTGLDADGHPHGLATSRFTPVSTDPPVVAFVPDRDSPAWARIASRGSFCVNVLSAQQEHLSRRFASEDTPENFAEVAWTASASGAPIIEGVVAWVECDVRAIDEVGDHRIVVGEVQAVGGNDGVPLVAFRGGFGGFAALSLAARGDDLMQPLNLVDRGRAELEAAAADLGGRVVVQTLVGNEVVYIASVGTLPESNPTVAMTIGTRHPAIPPLASLFMAWEDPELVEIWIGFLGSDDARARARLRLQQVRERGYTVYVADPENATSHERVLRMIAEQRIPARAEELTREQLELIENLSVDVLDFSPDQAERIGWFAVPVFGPDHRVSLVLGLEGLPFPSDWHDFERRLARMEQAASNVMRAIGGHVPVNA